MPPADGDSWETSVRSVTLCTRFHATLQVSLSFGPAEPLHTPPRRRWTSADVPLQVHCSRCSRGVAKVVTTVARGCPPPQAPQAPVVVVVVVAGLSGGGGGRRPG